jgi:hypothetical protein
MRAVSAASMGNLLRLVRDKAALRSGYVSSPCSAQNAGSDCLLPTPTATATGRILTLGESSFTLLTSLHFVVT